ncbi:MAG: acyl-CoA desaturase [Gammaproteobacteria bacterium]|nr:acyl-CoA desaturase [Gammaproteobacteria bacterium]
MVQFTIMGVTLYLHRDQAHRGLDLHPVLRHIFRLWLWLSTGQGTGEWVAVHRKHHAKCETEDDPHSPKIYGLKKVLLEGAELYRAEATNEETFAKYSRGTPNDWLERNVYRKYTFGGIALMVLIDLFLFGVPGIIIIAVQMISMPLFAAGIINGVGHHSGYRNFECPDAATNIVPWGVFLGGEELHNNHHAFPSSSKFSVRSWEFDIGWLYIKVLSVFGLAKVRRVAPTPVFAEEPKPIDLETVRAVIVNRMHVLRDYSRRVTLPVLKAEAAQGDPSWRRALTRARKLLIREQSLLDDTARERLGALLDDSQALRTVHEFRERLQALWNGANVSNDRLLAQLRDWCARAEASGIRSLQELASVLRSYSMQPAAATA